ncbi:MAG: hypothetical protein ACK5MI_02005 [Mangrovibacterium sp.]
MNVSIKSGQQNNRIGTAILAAGLACFIFGLTVVLSEASESVKHGLQWINSVGPLSGKVGISIISWGISWIALSWHYAHKPAMDKKLCKLGIILILLSFLLTFPPFFTLLA